MAVFIVQPFDTNISLICTIDELSTSSPDIVYAIRAIGITISFAGNPRTKATSITPSSPIILANGSKKLVRCSKIVSAPILVFAKNQIIIPAGKATHIALPRTNKVLSKIDLTITLPHFGTLYGGNSNVNEDTSPFKTVIDSNFEMAKVIPTPIIITIIKINIPPIEEIIPEYVSVKNIVIIDIIVGNLPLHGINEFVRIAINLSRGESIILVPITPHALQPNPMHIVSACFPQALHFLKVLSKLNATLGRYPKSSSIVNRGKKIAIGGSITAITHVKTLYPPPKQKTRKERWYVTNFKQPI